MKKRVCGGERRTHGLVLPQVFEMATSGAGDKLIVLDDEMSDDSEPGLTIVDLSAADDSEQTGFESRDFFFSLFRCVRMLKLSCVVLHNRCCFVSTFVIGLN